MANARLCSVCSRPVEPDRYGRVRQFHPDCRRAWRSESMRGNRRRAGKHKPVRYLAGPADPLKTDAYQGLDAAAIRRVGVAYWGALADFAYWCYDILNPLCFGGRVRHPLFQFCRVMPYGRCTGLSHVEDLDRPVIDVFLSLWTRRKSRHVAVFAVITHEMLHFDADARWRDAGQGRFRTSHDNEFWLSGVERISPTLGIDLRRMDAPFERWPNGGWTASQAKELETMLSNRRYAL